MASIQDLVLLSQRLAAAEARIVELQSARRWRVTRSATSATAFIFALTYLCSSTLHALSAGQGQSIEGPFTVTSHGHVIFSVKASADGEQNQVLLFGADGAKAVVALLATDTGTVAVGDGKGGETSRTAGFKAGLTVSQYGGVVSVADIDNKLIAAIRKGPNSQGLAVYRPGTEKIAFDALVNGSQAKMVLRNLEGDASGIILADGISLALNDNAGQAFALLDSGEVAEGAPPDPGNKRGMFLFNKKGSSVANLAIDTKDQGYVSVKSDDDSEAILGLKQSGTGSELILSGPGRRIGAELNSTDPAGLWLFGATAVTSVAEMTTAETGGRLMLADPNGAIMLEGLITDTGRGLLRAGPRIGGPIEMTGLPFAVMGKK